MTCKKCKKCCKWVFWLIVVAIIGIQFVPVDRSNPTGTGMIEAPQDVMAILRRSCFDCHSNETNWPWYSYVAPVSWLVASDVEEGLDEMNFSIWDQYSQKRRNHKIEQCGELVEEGEMPLWFYIPLHPEAALSQNEIERLVRWARGA